jgi:hypothetical protein
VSLGGTIDSQSINGFHVCDNIDSIISRAAVYKKQYFEDEDKSWCGFYFRTSDSNWILVETRDDITNKVSRISTNSPLYSTSFGLRVGDTVKEIIKNDVKFNINVELGKISFYLPKHELWITIKNPFKKSGFIEKLENGEVSEGEILNNLNHSGFIEKITILSYCN